MPPKALVTATEKVTRAARKNVQAGPSATKKNRKSLVEEEPVPIVTFDLARGGRPEREETSRAVAHFLKYQFSDRVERHNQIRANLASNALSTLQQLQAISGDARQKDEMPRLTPENPVWSKLSNPVLQEMLVALASDPDGFAHKHWEKKGILQDCSDDIPSEKRKVHYYLRTRTVPLKVAEAEDSAFLRSHPVNMGFVMARKWSRGLAEQSKKEIEEILSILGYKDAAFDIPASARSTRPTKVANHYLGMTTAENPNERQKHDARNKGTSLHLNLVGQEDKGYPWKTWKILPLTQEVEGPLTIRQDPTLGDIESILISLLPMSSNSQPGGHIFNVSFDPHIAEPIRSLVQRLPLPVQAVSNTIMEKKLAHEMEMMKALFSSMREAGLDVGRSVSEKAFENCLRELCQRIRTVNGLATMFTVLKDTPAEVQSGKVKGALFEATAEIGHAIVLHRNIIQYHLRDVSHFERMGPHISFWMIIIIHRWWGCLVLLVGRFIRVLNPLVLHTHSMVVNGVMTSQELVGLAREFPDEMELTVDTVRSTRLMEMQAPAEVRDFVDRVGVLKIIKTGPKNEHKSILASNYDPGATSYHSMLRKFETRLMALVTCKEIALDRVAEKFAADGIPEGFAGGRDELLAAVIAEVEKLCEASGVSKQIEACRQELKLMKRGMYAFSSKKLEDGRVVRTGQGASRVMTNINFGLRARGDPYSREREVQLDEVSADYRAAVSGGLGWTLKGPERSTPGSPEFDLWFLSRAVNTSFRQSSNHYAQPAENTTARLAQNLSLVQKTHQLAVERREQRIAIYGSWSIAEFMEKTKEVLKLALVFRGKVRPFTESLRIATCRACGSLAAGYDRNASHLCTHDLAASQSRQVVLGTGQSTEPQFSNYLVVLYVHDVVQYPGIHKYLQESTLGEWGIFSSPASEFLFDKQDRLLDHLPRCLGEPGVLGLDTPIYRTDDTHVNVCVAAAIDVVLKQNTKTPFCWAFDGPDQGSHWNTTTVKTASTLLAETPADFEVRICKHPGCGHTRLEHKNKIKSNKHKHGDAVAAYRVYVPKNLFQIPYFFSRVLVYRALVENDATCARAMMFHNS